MIIPILIALAVTAGDIVTKLLVAGRLPFGADVPVINGVLRFTNVSNPGMAFGLLGSSRWIFISLSVVLLTALGIVFVKERNYAKCVYVFFALIFGGGLGNLIDRVVSFGVYDAPGSVVDFIDFCAFPDLWKWTFNVADAGVTVGVFLFIGYLLFFEKKAYEHGKTPVLYEDKTKKDRRNGEDA